MLKITTNLVLLVLLFFIIRYLFPIILPFLIGFTIVFFIKHYLNNYHLFIQIICLLLFYLLLIIIIYLIYLIIKQTMINYEPLINPYLKQLIPASTTFLPSIIDALKNISTLCYQFLLIFIFSITSLIEYQVLIKLINTHLNKKQLFLLTCVKKQIKIQIKITLSLALLTLGFSLIIFTLIKLPNHLALALITTLLDAIPLIGSGIIYLPLIIIYYLNHNYINMFITLIGFLLMNIIRSYLEPRLYGQNIHLPNSIMFILFSISFYLFNMYAFFIIPLITSLFTYYKIKQNVMFFN